MKYLVTGANGHLGNNVVRQLIAQGKHVRATVRNTNRRDAFEGLDCELVYADILDRKSLEAAFVDIDVIFHVAAVFKHWAKDAQKEIIQANNDGTRNVLEVAAKCSVTNIVYVSSISALDQREAVQDETSWGSQFPNPYFQSKCESEKLAWTLAKELKLQLISILPSAMIGPRVFDHTTPVMTLLNNIVHNRMKFDPQYGMHFIHVEDVAKGMIEAEKRELWGERIILGSQKGMLTTEVFEIAHRLFPEIHIPAKLPKRRQLLLAWFMKIGSRFSGNPPFLQAGNVHHYFQNLKELNTEKARRMLNFSPRSVETALKETLIYLHGRQTS